MKTRSVTANVVYNMLYQLFTTCLPIITTPYLTRTLGLSQCSVFSFVETIVTLFTIIGAVGTSLYGCRKIAYVRDDRQLLSRTAYEIIFLKLLLLIPVSAVYIAIFCITGEYSGYFWINLVTVISSAVEVTWFFNGIEDFKLVSIRNFIIKVIFVVCLFVFIKTPDDLWKYITLVCVSDLLGNLSMWVMLPRYLLPLRNFRGLSVVGRIRESLALFVPQSANYIYSLSDKAMLGYLTPELDNVGIYDYGYRIVKMILGLLQSMGYVLLSRISNLASSNDTEGIRKYINKSISFTMLLSLPMAFGVVGISRTFVPFYLGGEFAEVSTVLIIISPLIFLTSFNSVLGVQLLLAVKKDKEYTFATVGGALINIFLNFVFIPRFGIYAACASSLISEAAVLAVQFYSSREYVSVISVIRSNYRYLLAALIMFAVCVTVGMLPFGDLTVLVIQLAVSVCVYFGLLFVMRDKLFLEILDRILSFFRKTSEK